MRTALTMTLALAAMVLTACGGDDEDDRGSSDPTNSAPGQACVESMRTMDVEADGDDPDGYEDLVSNTLDACGDVDEWLAAARLYPGAVAVTSAEFVDTITLDAACPRPLNGNTPVCRSHTAK